MKFRGVFAVLAIVAGGSTIAIVGPQPVDAATCEAAAIGGPPSVPPTLAQETGFHAVAPTRLVDTRESGVKVRAGCTTVIDVGSTTGVPVEAVALALNVTTVNAGDRGFLTLFPCGSARPVASNVNTRRGDAAANSVLVQVDATRQVCAYSQNALDLIVDMTGWFGRFGAPYHATSPTRLLDTRTPLRPDGGAGPLLANTELHLPVIGDAVPSAARAVAVNVTVTDGAGAGFVTALPCSSDRPSTSTVNFLAAEQRANHVVVGIDSDGELCLSSSVGVQVVVDVEGWFGGALDSGTLFRPLLGSRVLDTRDVTGTSGAGKPGAGTTLSFDPSAQAALPLGSTVALNVIATEATAPGFVTLYPCGIARPDTSVVNAVVGNEATNVGFVTVEPDSKVCAYVSSPMHVVVDVIGTFGAGGPLHALTVGALGLNQVFAADAHDYTTKCAAGANTFTVHAVGAPGATVSVAPSTAPAPVAVGETADLTFTLREDEALVVRAGAAGATPEQYWVRCLPHDFPAIQVSGAVVPNPGWYLTDAAFPTTPPATDQSRFLMILDNRSVPVWYHRVASPTIDLSLLPDGTLAWTKLLGLAFGSMPDGAFEIHRLDGSLVRAVSTVGGPTDHHDIAELPNGDIVLASYVPRQHVDLRVLGTGFGSDELVYDAHLQEIRPDGSVAWTWNSEDHIPVSASTYAQRFPGIAGVGVDLVHLNSIQVAPDGDLIVSMRHTDTVYKIRRNATGDIVWRVGGNQSDMRFVGDPLGGFGRQHDAQLLPGGILRLFDNRTGLSGSPRAVEYAIDAVQHTATLISSRSDPSVTSSGGVGSVRGIGDGDLVVAWGGSSSPAFTEFGADGSALQATTLVGHYPYRVEKQPTTAFDISVLRATAGR